MAKQKKIVIIQIVIIQIEIIQIEIIQIVIIQIVIIQIVIIQIVIIKFLASITIPLSQPNDGIYVHIESTFLVGYNLLDDNSLFKMHY